MAADCALLPTPALAVPHKGALGTAPSPAINTCILWRGSHDTSTTTVSVTRHPQPLTFLQKSKMLAP